MIENLLAEFDHILAGMAWNLWRELGVPGTSRLYENCLVQPEELIILTALIEKNDPRLRDEALDWLSRYHTFISVSRLRTFLNDLDSEVLQSFSQFASSLNAVSSAKWPMAERGASVSPILSGKSLLPSLHAPSLLQLRLRNLFGPGAKADVLTVFLTSNALHFSASDLIEVGYAKRSLMTALDQLAASGLLEASLVKNRKNYELRKPKELQVIIGKLPKIAPPWIKILKAIIAIRAVIPELQNSSEITRGIILRNCLIKIESLLPYFSSIIHAEPDFKRDWMALKELFKSFSQGNFPMEFDVHSDLDKIVIQLLSELYRVNDCVDGIEMILSEKEFKDDRHKEVYKECYQLFLSFKSDLELSLKHFFDFPIHKMMDEALADIFYRFSKEKLPHLIEKVKQVQSIDRITTPQLAARQYQMFMPELDILRQFIYTFRKRLEDLYFIQTNVNLLSLPTTLYKRHLVLDLFLKDDLNH